MQITFLTRLFTEQFKLVVKQNPALWSRVEKLGSPKSKSVPVMLLNFAQPRNILIHLIIICCSQFIQTANFVIFPPDSYNKNINRMF